MMGTCKYRDSVCDYYHPVVCPHFRKGTCKYGNACKDLHGQQRPIQKARKLHQAPTANVAQDTNTASDPKKKKHSKGRKQSSSGKSGNGSDGSAGNGKKAKKQKKSTKKDSGHAKKKQSSSPR